MKTAFLHFGGAFVGMPSGPFTTIQADLIETKQPIDRNVSGYGSKRPLPYKVKNEGRFYRVYCCIYGNSGTCYIMSKGKAIATVDIY
jgi:hypothetical protein